MNKQRSYFPALFFVLRVIVVRIATSTSVSEMRPLRRWGGRRKEKGRREKSVAPHLAYRLDAFCFAFRTMVVRMATSCSVSSMMSMSLSDSTVSDS